MTLEPMRLLQDENETKTTFDEGRIGRLPNGDRNSGNGIISWIFSGSQNFLKSPLLEGTVTPVAHIESVIFKSKKPTIPKLQPHIDYIKALLDKKGRTDFSKDTIAIYLYKKFFTEANDARKNKKYDNAIKKYKLVLEYVQEIKKDENEAEDIQNLIAICYGQLGLQNENDWKKELKAYQEALKFAKDPKLIKQIEGNKIAIVWHKLKEARALITNGLYQEASKICDKILEPSLKFEESHHNLIKNGAKDYHTWCTIQGLLDQADKNPKISIYNSIITKVTESFKTATYLSQDGQIYYPEDFIARACNGIIKCHQDQKQYSQAKAAYERGLKFSKSLQTFNDLQKNHISTLKLCGEDLFKKKEFAESAQKYHEAFEVIKNLPDALKEKIEISVELIEYLIQIPNIEQAIENISKAWEAFADPQYQFSSDFLDTILLNKIKLQIEFADFCLHQKNFRGTLENRKEVLEICQDKDIRELIQKGIIEAWILYIDHLNESNQSLKEVQKLLNYHFDKNANFKVTTTCLNQVKKVLEQARPDDIINLNITPEAIHLQIDIMHIVAKHLRKIGRPDEAVAKYNQILESDITDDEFKHQVEKEKSNLLMALARQTEESGTLDEIIIAYDAAILSSSNDLLKTSLRKKCFAVIANFKTNTVNSDNPKEFLELYSKAISEITDEKLKSGINSKINYELGLAKMKQGVLDQNRELLDQAIKLLDQASLKAITSEDKNLINKDRAELLSIEIDLHLKDRQSDKAIEAFIKLKKICTTGELITTSAKLYTQHHNWVVQAKKNGDYKEAIEIWGQMLRLTTNPAAEDKIIRQINELLNEAHQKAINLYAKAEEAVDLYEKAENLSKAGKYKESLELSKQVESSIQQLQETLSSLSKINISLFGKDDFPNIHEGIQYLTFSLNAESTRLSKISEATSIIGKRALIEQAGGDFGIISPHPGEAADILGAGSSDPDVEG